jgi:hypothetical protein
MVDPSFDTRIGEPFSEIVETCMSSPAREPLTGIIRQDRKIVGGICLPEENLGDFIDQFNHCYGPLKMRIEMPVGLDRTGSDVPLLPVGAGMFNPFRRQSSTTSLENESGQPPTSGA